MLFVTNTTTVWFQHWALQLAYSWLMCAACFQIAFDFFNVLFMNMMELYYLLLVLNLSSYLTFSSGWLLELNITYTNICVWLMAKEANVGVVLSYLLEKPQWLKVKANCIYSNKFRHFSVVVQQSLNSYILFTTCLAFLDWQSYTQVNITDSSVRVNACNNCV